MFVIGTAGHVDHGKSSLIRALTGIDPDRLPEEKERGMTIDLGFAWLKLPGGREVSIVDVPGHERLIKNMVAGVGGVDLALLVIAANEGPMAQTREHLAILDLLEVRRGIIVITKKDLVDEEWLGLVIMETQEMVKTTSLAGSNVIAVSSTTGEGIPALISTIDQVVSKLEAIRDLGRPRLPLDRVFTIAGSGTVVTGTLMDGSLTIGQEVEILPVGLPSRIRGLQTHKTRIEKAEPGSRVAANLTNVSPHQLKRGDVVTTLGWLRPSTRLTLKLRATPYLSRPIRNNATVSFHCGPIEAVGKVRLLQTDKLEAGQSTFAQVILDAAVPVGVEDGFIIRSNDETVGGGKIVETDSRRYRRRDAGIIATLERKETGSSLEKILTLVEAKQPVSSSGFASLSQISAEELKASLSNLVERKLLLQVGSGDQAYLFTAAGWEQLSQKVNAMVSVYHQKFPTRPGIPRAELINKLGIEPRAVSAVLTELARQRTLVEDGGNLSLSSHQVELTTGQQAKVTSFLNSLAKPDSSPEALDPDLVKLLIRRGDVVKLNESILISSASYKEFYEKVVSLGKDKGEFTLAETRDILGTNRKTAQALLEHMDQLKVTRRIGDKRQLRTR